MSGVGLAILRGAHYELLRAAEAYRLERDVPMAGRARELAVLVRAADPLVQQHVLLQLPEPDARRIRSQCISDQLDYPDDVVSAALEELRRQRKASQSGGWWRRRA